MCGHNAPQQQHATAAKTSCGASNCSSLQGWLHLAAHCMFLIDTHSYSKAPLTRLCNCCTNAGDKKVLRREEEPEE